ncbi:MAG: YidC/Oxa1 family membrane protein insertase [Spirochaetaceae bacterium]|jgi:membrane protein insertase Oxa1/YidC/SpoIIIJ|nr:YidC/Oxa1 family membrane protein insertase [Spirochaetaceae bacterium]
MSEFLFTLFIWPVEQMLSLCYIVVYRLFHSPAAALAGLSAAVSVFTLPLYLRAETWQHAERSTQARMAAKIARIKSVFSGDERFMILSTYYRQNNYHPIYALRSSMGMLIQVPFFIAAYVFISHIETLSGASFWIIKDLAKPDGLLPALAGGGGSRFHNSINALPILMALFNTASTAVYTAGFNWKEKLPLYGMNVLFFALLYNSPAGLVFYWTLNNVLSLVKNVLSKTKNPQKILFAVLTPALAVLDYYLLFMHSGDLPKRLFALCLITGFYSGAFVIKALYAKPAVTVKTNTHVHTPYILAALSFFLLSGIVIPSSLVASSVAEFSFETAPPFALIRTTMVQAAGAFLVWGIGLYFLFSPRIRSAFTFAMCALLVAALVNVFAITENFGFLTVTMKFSELKPFQEIPAAYCINLALMCAAGAAALLAIRLLKRVYIVSAESIIILALCGIIAVNTFKIYDGIEMMRRRETNSGTPLEAAFTFSKTGKNVLVIMLDCAVGFYLPYIFDEKPELREAFDGFTWYPNCVSFSSHTLIGALPVYGGYEYTPRAVNAREEVTLVEKQKEAYLLLPRLFSQAGFTVTVSDPPFDNYTLSNLAPFAPYPEIRAFNLDGVLTAGWLREHPGIKGFDAAAFLCDTMIQFSLFKCSPLVLRYLIYNDGLWLHLKKRDGTLTGILINDYALMDSLNNITSFAETGNTYTAVYGHLSHNGTVMLGAPDYNLDNAGGENTSTGPLANDGFFNSMTASFILLGRWFDAMRANGTYDNTRIIIVADHGRGFAPVPENIKLPNGGSLQAYNPLLLVKDFGGGGGITERREFMTNADVPLIALSGIISAPKNPATGNVLQSEKDGGAAVTTLEPLSTYKHSKYAYTIRSDRWLFVRGNIFDTANWRKGER